MQRRLLLVGAILIALLILLSGVATRQLHWLRERPSERQSAVGTAELERRIAEERVTGNTANATKGNSQRAIVISAQLSGVVSRILASPGSQVTAGDPLVQFDDQEARTKLESASAKFEEAKASVQLHENELATASSAIKQTQELSKQKQIPAEELARAEGTVKAMQAALNESRADLALAKTRFESAKRELSLHLIRTPNSGIVSEVHAKVGDSVRSGGPLMVIRD